MNSTIKSLLFIFVIAVIIFLISQISAGKKKEFPYVLKKNFLNKTELKIFEGIVNTGYLPFPKVRVIDFIGYEFGKKIPIKYLSQVSSRSVDFLVCDANSLQPVAIVTTKSRESDFIKKLANKIGIAYILIPASFDIKKIDTLFRETIQNNGK